MQRQRPGRTLAVLWTMLVGSGCACVARPPRPPEQVVESSPASPNTSIAWATVDEALRSIFCVYQYEGQDGELLSLPSYGDRNVCELGPPRTALERAVANAFAAAKPVLISLRTERAAAFEAAELPDAQVRIRAVQAAYSTEAFLGVLLPRLLDALNAEGLRCEGCPTAVHPRRRERTWVELEPYLVAHAWPDPVVTPRDPDGRATGQPRLSAHICGGFNGLDALADPDEYMVRAGYLALFHTDAAHRQIVDAMVRSAADAEYKALQTDEARTQYLRAVVGPRVVNEPSVRAALCKTLARFETDTGIVVTDCAESS